MGGFAWAGVALSALGCGGGLVAASSTFDGWDVDAGAGAVKSAVLRAGVVVVVVGGGGVGVGVGAVAVAGAGAEAGAGAGVVVVVVVVVVGALAAPKLNENGAPPAGVG